MIYCDLKFEDDVIYTNCVNYENDKNCLMEIFDIDSNLKLFNFYFHISNYMNIWHKLSYSIKDYNFINGYKILITNIDNNEKEYDGYLLIKSYSKTKFVDSENILSLEISEILNQNYLNSFKIFKNDSLNIKDCDTLIDLGSSIGLFTSYCLEQNHNIKSYCVEMNPKFHKICQDTFKNNNNIIPINAAIYKEHNSYINFKSNREDLFNLGNTISDGFNDKKYSLNVPTVSLKGLIDDFNIDRISFLKVDIEGYEYEFFENLEDELLDKIDKIFLEFHPVDDNYRKLNLINRLMIKGFKMTSYDQVVNFYSSQMFSIYFFK